MCTSGRDVRIVPTIEMIAAGGRWSLEDEVGHCSAPTSLLQHNKYQDNAGSLDK